MIAFIAIPLAVKQVISFVLILFLIGGTLIENNRPRGTGGN